MLLTIEGMTCTRCVAHVTQALQRVAPAARISVDLATGTASIDGPADADQVIAAVVEAGYPAQLGAAADRKRDDTSCCGSCRS